MEENRNTANDTKDLKRDRSERKQRKVFKGIMKIIIWCCVIIVLIVATLFISSRIAEFDSIDAMLRFIFGHF